MSFSVIALPFIETKGNFLKNTPCYPKFWRKSLSSPNSGTFYWVLLAKTFFQTITKRNVCPEFEENSVNNLAKNKSIIQLTIL